MSNKELKMELARLEALFESDAAIQQGRFVRIIELKKTLGIYKEPVFDTSGTGKNCATNPVTKEQPHDS